MSEENTFILPIVNEAEDNLDLKAPLETRLLSYMHKLTGIMDSFKLESKSGISSLYSNGKKICEINEKKTYLYLPENLHSENYIPKSVKEELLRYKSEFYTKGYIISNTL